MKPDKLADIWLGYWNVTQANNFLVSLQMQSYQQC